MDRISNLPKAILHDILGRLPDKDAAKTCVLSKSWRETWFSFPILSVCSKNFLSFHDIPLYLEDPLSLGKLNILIEYVSKRLMRLRHQGLTVKELKLDLKYIIEHSQVARHIDQWIQMAIESGVEVLELHLTADSLDDWYNLPLCLTEAKSLTKLVLSGGIRLDPAFLNHSLDFFLMKTLSLSHILFGYEGVMEHFISHCTLIEHLTLEFCNVDNSLSIGEPPGSRTYRVKLLSLHGLQKLKGADVQGIVAVDIDAPNLENLCYRAPADKDVSFKLNFHSCTNLKCLSLCHLRSPHKWLLEQIDKIPFLENSMLHDYSMFEYKRLNLSGPQLKFFRLSDCSYLNVVNIDAPNLLSCHFSGEDKPAISFQRNSNQLELNAHFGMDNRHLYSLRHFVENIKPQEVLASFSLFIHDHEPYSFFYEMLMDKKKSGHYIHSRRYLRSRHQKFCWRGLKVVKVTHLERTYENVEDLKAMLDALPESRVAEYVSFGLEL